MDIDRERYQRWREYSITHLTFAINLLLSFGVAGLGFSMHLLTGNEFHVSGAQTLFFLVALVGFAVSLVCGFSAVLTRQRDFRLTAQTIKEGKAEERDELRGITTKLGKVTFRLFKVQTVALAVSSVALFVCLILVYQGKL